MEEPKEQDQNEEMQKCTRERDEYLDGWKRTKADLINYKKDEGKRFEMMMKFGQEAIMRELVGVLDSMEIAVRALAADEKNKQGLALIKTQLEEALKKYGLEAIETKKGDVFDPTIHEAIASESGDTPNMILEVIEEGYILNGKMIRAARVKVSK